MLDALVNDPLGQRRTEPGQLGEFHGGRRIDVHREAGGRLRRGVVVDESSGETAGEKHPSRCQRQTAGQQAGDERLTPRRNQRLWERLRDFGRGHGWGVPGAGG